MPIKASAEIEAAFLDKLRTIDAIANSILSDLRTYSFTAATIEMGEDTINPLDEGGNADWLDDRVRTIQKYFSDLLV